MSDNDDPDTWHKRSFWTFKDTDSQNWNGEWFFPYSKLFRIYIEREKREQMDLKVYSDLKASLKKLHITAAKDVDYSGGNKTVVVIFLLVFKPAKAFQSRSYRLGLCFRMRTAFTYRSPRAASTYSVYSVWRKIHFVIISLFAIADTISDPIQC